MNSDGVKPFATEVGALRGNRPDQLHRFSHISGEGRGRKEVGEGKEEDEKEKEEKEEEEEEDRKSRRST